MIDEDAYLAYIRRFFGRWSRVYDLFVRPIGFAYAATARRAGAEPGRRILDVCTGTGEMAMRCARLGATVTAIDVTSAMLDRAAGKARAAGLSIDFRVMDARRLHFGDASFDTAILSFALHDMPREARIASLREAARVARETVVVLDYDFPRREPGRTMVIGMVGLYETAYLAGFARDGLEPVLVAAGLESVDVCRLVPGFCASHVMRQRAR